MQTLVPAAARTARQEDAGWAEYVCYLIRVLIHDIHQLLYWSTVAAAPYFIEGHHCRETEGQVRLAVTCSLMPQTWLRGSAHTNFTSSTKPLDPSGVPLLWTIAAITLESLLTL